MCFLAWEGLRSLVECIEVCFLTWEGLRGLGTQDLPTIGGVNQPHFVGPHYIVVAPFLSLQANTLHEQSDTMLFVKK